MSEITQQGANSLPRRTLIVGNLGYIGPVLTQYLTKDRPQVSLLGYDNAYFAGCLINPFKTADHLLDSQLYGDVRNVDPECLIGVDSVIYLAAISNDPMGNIYEIPTAQINADAAVQCAKLAKAAGARRFVFASSCSVYGSGGDEAKGEDSPLNPLTAYARSKIDCENALRPLASKDFVVTCLRFATACGASPRLRLDLVLNDFVASAMLKKEIEILSDGTPWRPLIDVEDMCRAILWALDRKKDAGGSYLAVNVGFDEWNYTIRDLAHAVSSVLGNTTVRINSSAAPDRRSYRVDFSRYKRLAVGNGTHKPIETTISELADNIENSPFREADFRKSHLIRLNALNELRRTGRLNANLEWQVPVPPG